MAPNLTNEQMIRHARTIALPEIGTEGVNRLMKASVIIVGAGALGCITAMYLAAAGIGCIGIIDFDTVGLSNLQRQLAYTETDLGLPKVQVLEIKLHAINPDVRIKAYNAMLTQANAPELLSSYDIIIEGSDNPATKYLVSDTAAALHRPCVIGGVRGFIGQITTQLPDGPTYRDFFPEPPETCGLTPCSTTGVLGPVPGLIASLQATEAIKLLTGIGCPLSGRLLQIDTLTMKVWELTESSDSSD
ncbi:MAG: HesA/MoeB/ThiF family protein [Muribaculaceae bacterium]|nr:HesA/MoeB/ThiF family protein [Muribaculaceae bacterium]